MQDQLVGMERVLAKEKVMFDENEHGVASCVEMLIEELMGQNEAHTWAGIHTLTIKGPPWAESIALIVAAAARRLCCERLRTSY